MSRFCSFCGCSHPLTSGFWYRLDTYPRCKAHVSEKRNAYYLSNRDKCIAKMKERREKDPESHKENNRKWREANREKHRENARKWYYANKERALKRHAEYFKQREKTDISFRISRRLRNRVWHVAKGKVKAGSAVACLGCSLDEFRLHIEQKFTPDMNWDNYGTVWELDHIIPLSWFELDNSIHFEIACHYTNLQPLLVADNRKKRDNLS